MEIIAQENLEQILEELEASREDLQKFSRNQRIRKLDHALAQWLAGAPSFHLACTDVADATGYAPGAVEVSLRRTLTAWRAPHLEKVIAEAESAPGNHQPPRLVAAIMAQNTPGLAIPPVVLSLALGAPLLLKSAAGEPHLARHLLRLLNETCPELGQACREVYWAGGSVEIEKFVAATIDRVLVYGGEETIAHWQSLARPRVLAHGPRVSVALVGEATSDAEVDALAEQIALLDQRGCLSPQAILISSQVDIPAIGARLEKALVELQRKWPRRALPGAEATDFREAVDAAEIAVAAGRSQAFRGGHAAGFGIEVTMEPTIQPSPLDRMIRLHPYESASELAAQLRPLRDKLECIGVAGTPPDVRVLQSSGARRICAVGDMQNPPAAWHPVAPWFVSSID